MHCRVVQRTGRAEAAGKPGERAGTIALVRNGDRITIDAVRNTITLHVDEAELARRRAAWKQPPLKATKGVLYKYAQCVSSASTGCVTDQR